MCPCVKNPLKRSAINIDSLTIPNDVIPETYDRLERPLITSHQLILLAGPLSRPGAKKHNYIKVKTAGLAPAIEPFRQVILTSLLKTV